MAGFECAGFCWSFLYAWIPQMLKRYANVNKFYMLLIYLNGLPVEYMHLEHAMKHKEECES